MNLLARLTIWSGEFSSPASWLEESLSISRQIGNQESEIYALGISGTLAYRQCNYEQASAYYHQEISLAEKTGDYFQNLWAHVHLAYTVLHQGEVQQARVIFEDSIQHMHDAGLTIRLSVCHRRISQLECKPKHPERAAKLFAWADAMRIQIGDIRPFIEQNSVDRDLAVIHGRIDDIEYARLSAQGRSMTVKEAIILALEKIDNHSSEIVIFPLINRQASWYRERIYSFAIFSDYSQYHRQNQQQHYSILQMDDDSNPCILTSLGYKRKDEADR